MLGSNVFDMAVQRLVEQYEQGHRLVVSLSGGKDSTCVLECAVIAARMTGRLPVEAVHRDEEIQYPGTFEYLERVHDRDDVDLTWLVANQPIINAFDRQMPYWWVFDPLLEPEEWVRQPPPYHRKITALNIEAMVSQDHFPTPPPTQLMACIGLRVQESRARLMGLHSSGGYLTKPMARTGVRNVRPIYDWTDGDIWLAIQKNGWDYSKAYDVMNRYGIPRKQLRVGPPTMNPGGGLLLQKVGSVAWPDWWNRVCRRLPSIRSYALYGKRAVVPDRRLGETWKECFQRTCIDTAPAWIAERATTQRDRLIHAHLRHASSPDLPEIESCYGCQSNLGSWKALTNAAYLGDPFSVKMSGMPYVEPEFFRPGAGRWNGSPG
jgi:predicted phosphoadenosine phosphosulfate sulfurtransferase